MKILRPWNAVWASLFLFACLVLWMPASAQGAQGGQAAADDPGSYGAWGNDPRQGASNGVTIEPFNTKQEEMNSFSCIINGQPLSTNSVDVLAQIGRMSMTIQRGKVDENSFGGKSDDTNEGADELWNQENFGFPSGPEGVKKFIQKEKIWLRRSISWINEGGDNKPNPKVSDGLLEADPEISAWTNHDNREFESGSGQSDGTIALVAPSSEASGDRYHWSGDKNGEQIWLYVDKDKYREKDSATEAIGGFPLTLEQGKRVASLLKDNPRSVTDIYVNTGPNAVPDGCIPALFDGGLDTEFGDLFSDPGAFIASIIFSPVIDISNSIYRNFSSQAYGALFHTPHTERGDLIWDLDADCLADDATSDDPKEVAAGKAQVADTCQNNTPLGFSKKNTKANVKERPLYLDIASLIAWLITGTYFIILFAAAVVFIYRGNKSQKFNLMKVAPRILLSMLIAIAAPFLIGALITVSNWTTLGIFDLMDDSGSPLTTMNLTLSQAGDMLELPLGDLSTTFATAVVSVIAAGASLVFMVGVLVKQLAMIFLIVLAPIAIFCLIVDSWRPKFMRWLKALFVLALLPVVLAALLMLGVLLNPIMDKSVSGTLSFLLLVATLFAMGWVLKTGLSIAIRGKNTNVLNGLMQAGGMLTQKLGAGATLMGLPMVGGALGVAGQGIRAGGSALNKSDVGDKLAGALIPEGRGAGGSRGNGMHALMRGSRGIAHGWQIGQRRRGITGRTGGGGRAGRRFGSFGDGDEGDEKHPRQGATARTFRRMKSSIGRAKQIIPNRINARHERGLREGGRDWTRPSTFIPFGIGRRRSSSFADRIQGVRMGDQGNEAYHNFSTIKDPARFEALRNKAKGMEGEAKSKMVSDEIARRKAELQEKLDAGEINKAQYRMRVGVLSKLTFGRLEKEAAADPKGELARHLNEGKAQMYGDIERATRDMTGTGQGLAAGSQSLSQARGGGGQVVTFDKERADAVNAERDQRRNERRENKRRRNEHRDSYEREKQWKAEDAERKAKERQEQSVRDQIILPGDPRFHQ